MNVIRAEVLGMCFGVRDALKRMGKIDDPENVTIHGQLVHNEVVVNALRDRGFATVPEDNRQAIPPTPIVLITAHGVSDRERERLQRANKALIDTTCPLVKRAHEAAMTLREQGYFVLVIGKRNHVEIRGIVEDLADYEVIETAGEVRTYPSRRLGIIAQTTAAAREVERIREAIRTENPEAEIRWIDTICLPTKEHQRSLERLLDKVDAMVVVGGKHSNNTKELTRLCQERGKPVLQISSSEEIQAEWFDGFETVGLTAGTSTLESTINDVEAVLRQIPRACLA